METLTEEQKKIGNALIDWALAAKDGEPADMVIEETELAKQLGEAAWKRSHAEDLNMLCSYCQRMEYPPVSLLVVIPGFGKPEKGLMIHAFKATLPTAEAEKRWEKELKAIKKTKQATWKEFKAAMQPAE